MKAPALAFGLLLVAGVPAGADIGVISPADAWKLIETVPADTKPVEIDTWGGHKDYLRGHLPTAHHLNFDTLRDTDKGVPV